MGVIIRPTEQEGGTVNVVKAIRDMRMECLEEGIAKGIEQGIVAGRAEGKAEAIRKMALYFRNQDATLTEDEAVKMAENILR